MLKKRQVAITQIVLGAVLFLLTIVASILIVKFVFIDGLVMGVSGSTETWGDVDIKMNGTSQEIMGFVVSDVILQSIVVKTVGYVFLACAIIMLTLSSILVLQGLYNLAKK